MTTSNSPAPDEHRAPVPPPAGRALLTWEGKRRPDAVPVRTPRPIEAFGAQPDDADAGRLFHGDNLDTLAHLLDRGLAGQVRLIYIDPPFDSGADYTRKVRLRDAQGHQLGATVEYRDIWPGDSYLQFMYARLLLLRELLAEDGSIWLHCDYRQVHRLHLLLEEVFGVDNYLNTIAWRSQVTRGAKVDAFYFPFSTQYIEVFAKNRRAPTVWHSQRKQLVFTRRQAAARFMEDEGGFFRTSDPGTYSFESLVDLHAQGRLYAPYGGEIVVDEANRRVTCSNGGNIGVKYYMTALDDGRFAVERGVDNMWDDIPGLGTTPGEDVGYPTQKTEALLRRVIAASTAPGDLVLDCFMGSGTTVAVAQQMGRRWIGGDANWGSLQATRRRLHRLAAGETPPAFTIATFAADGSPVESGPAQAAVQIRRLAGAPATMEVVIDDYGSAAVDARLAQRRTQVDVAPRALIEAVDIDPAYDGALFHPTVVDAPSKKRAQVEGVYRVGIGAAPATVAVRITDILGHETLVVQTI